MERGASSSAFRSNRQGIPAQSSHPEPIAPQNPHLSGNGQLLVDRNRLAVFDGFCTSLNKEDTEISEGRTTWFSMLLTPLRSRSLCITPSHLNTLTRGLGHMQQRPFCSGLNEYSLMRCRVGRFHCDFRTALLSDFLERSGDPTADLRASER